MTLFQNFQRIKNNLFLRKTEKRESIIDMKIIIAEEINSMEFYQQHLMETLKTYMIIISEHREERLKKVGA